MAVGASRGVVAEHVVDQIGKAAGDGEEGAVARRPRGCDSRLDQMPRAIEFVAQLVRRLAAALPCERFERLVDVRVAEDHASPLARATSRRNSEVVGSSGAFEFLGAAKNRDLPVHALPVREQAIPDGDAPGVDRAEPHPSGCRRRSARHQVGVVLYWDLPGRPDLGPVAPACRRHGPLVRYSGQLYPARVVLI
jgi:hypothetical protein